MGTSQARVLFGAYPTNRWSAGGKERQLRELSAELRTIGVDVDLLDPWAWDDADDADVLHLWGTEYYQHEMATRAKARGMKLVVSSILVYPSRRVERLTELWRFIDPLVPVATSFSLRRGTLHAADLVVCASQTEQVAMQRIYRVPASKVRQVPLSVSPRFRDATPDLFQQRIEVQDPILSVGRIEPRKNTLELVRAARRLDLPLVLIGASGVDQAYAEQVAREVDASPQIWHVDAVDAEDPLLASAYSAAKVHALISHSEQGGLANLEAAMAGANIVTARLPSTVEYFGDGAWYVDPKKPADIDRALKAAYDAPKSTELQDHVLARYSLGAVAAALRDIYAEVTDRPS